MTATQALCQQCEGAGVVNYITHADAKCDLCGGSGRIEKEVPMSIDRLTTLARRVIDLRASIYEERFDPIWKEPRREAASSAIQAAEAALDEAVRQLNVAIETERAGYE